MNESKYSDLIARIKTKRKWVLALTVIVELLILLLTTSSSFELNGDVVYEYAGVHPIVTILLMLIFLFISAMAYTAVSMPLTTALDNECDPEKQLILNIHLNKQKNIDHIYAIDYLYLGNFTEAVKYAEKMTVSQNESIALSGLFNRARCEFFLGDFECLHKTASEYKNKLSGSKTTNAKNKIAYQKLLTALDLMTALSEDDAEKINEMRKKVEAWNTSKATEGFLNYLKGLAAYKVGDKEEAIYRFKYVKENCPKLFFSNLAAEHLSSLI